MTLSCRFILKALFSCQCTSNMPSQTLLPPDFVQFLDQCKSLMNEVWSYKQNREDFLQFEENFEAFKKRNAQKFPLYGNLLGSFNKHIKIIEPKPKVIHKITFHYHDLVCQKTLVELKNQLSKYQLKRPKVCYKSSIFIGGTSISTSYNHCTSTCSHNNTCSTQESNSTKRIYGPRKAHTSPSPTSFTPTQGQ